MRVWHFFLVNSSGNRGWSEILTRFGVKQGISHFCLSKFHSEMKVGLEWKLLGE